MKSRSNCFYSYTRDMAIDWTLLKRSIISCLSEDEQKLLDQWQEESPEHRELYRNARIFLSDQESFRPGAERVQQFKMNYEKAIAQIKRQQRRRRVNRLTGIAALFLIAVGIAFAFWLNGGQQEQLAQLSLKIEPGTQKAVLVTDNGTTIELGREMEMAGGLKVKDNSLIYSESVTAGEGAENCLQIPRGGEYSVLLSDGTKVWLNSASELRYPVHFSGGMRKVYLKGEAYFQVTPDSEKAFIVVTDAVEVKVYGTEFNVNTRVDGCVQTVLVSGSVSVWDGKHSDQMLKPCQMAEYNRKDGLMKIIDVDVFNYISWKSGKYVFEDRSIEQIMEELSLWYDTEVFFQNDEARTQRFSGSLPRYREIKDMLNVIEKTTHVRFDVRGRTISVR